MNIGQHLAASATRLARAGIEEPMGDARRIMAHVTGAMIDATAELDTIQTADFAAKIEERRHHRPVSQIIGWREFWGRRFRVTSDVLDPRPETETIVEAVLNGPAPQHILDLGTGTGILAITLALECPQASVTATDISTAALAVAAENSRAHNTFTRIKLVHSDWFATLGGDFDLIVCNPPYIAAAEMALLAPDVRLWEPLLALSPGGDGLDAYRAIAKGLHRHLRPGGRALLEIGATQAPDVTAILRGTGLGPVALLQDLAGRDRVVTLHRAA